MVPAVGLHILYFLALPLRARWPSGLRRALQESPPIFPCAFERAWVRIPLLSHFFLPAFNGTSFFYRQREMIAIVVV